MKIQLQNGSSHSKPSVNPKDWQSRRAKVSQDWYILYRFYDPRYDKPKQVMIKGMNSFKKLAERQAETQRLLDKELAALKEGYNPFNKDAGVMPEGLPLIHSLKSILTTLTVSEMTYRDLNYSITKFEKAVKVLGLEKVSVTDISRKHLRFILDKSSKSEDSFNKNRSYMMIFYAAMCELEIVPSNFIRDIRKKKVVKHIRQCLNPLKTGQKFDIG